MQTTLVILKPDCMEQNLAGKILDRFAEKGLKIAGIKMLRLSDDLKGRCLIWDQVDLAVS